jgi:hypothetical protein
VTVVAAAAAAAAATSPSSGINSKGELVFIMVSSGHEPINRSDEHVLHQGI